MKKAPRILCIGSYSRYNAENMDNAIGKGLVGTTVTTTSKPIYK